MTHLYNAAYRLQMNRNFRLNDAYRIIPYLKQIGISDIYSSPLTCAEKGSLHGYDVIDPTRLNPEIGSSKSLEKFITLCQNYHLGLWLDIVPNHMASSSQNDWWQDVLKRGKKSHYASYFDIDWKNKKKLSYRRFFDINELVCLRIENNQVFNTIHQFVFELIKRNFLTGLRIDHIDGLLNPKIYLQRLNNKIYSLAQDPLLIIAEKILAQNEQLPTDWKISGTTGYDFLNAVNLIFIDPTGYQKLLTTYRELIGEYLDWNTVSFQCKKQVIITLFSEEIESLTFELSTIIKKNPLEQYCEPQQLREAITHITAALPVYRTYINKEKTSRLDRSYLRHALIYARETLGETFSHTLDLIENILLFNREKSALHWVMKWQQLTDPVMAKGYEDTACYVFNPLLSLNEVGSDPSMAESLGDLELFHAFLKKRRRHHPFSVNTTSTHDTKRSEDVRARINVLSELADEWALQLRGWRRQTNKIKIKLGDCIIPDVNLECLLYQSLLGAWPISTQRVQDFMIKAVREAKINSSWNQPNTRYETALLEFIENLLTPDKKNNFLHLFIPFQAKISFFGALNALSQLLIKLTSPGIPDIYQGNEIWNFSLVDPDNRQPVDYIHRIQLLKRLVQQEKQPNFISNLCQQWTDGRIKLFIIYKTLQFREQFNYLFTQGLYFPINSHGDQSLCVISYARTYRKHWVLTVTPRLTTRLVKTGTFPLGERIWENTHLILPAHAPKHWKNIFTNEIITVEKSRHTQTLALGDIFSEFPVSLLYGYT